MLKGNLAVPERARGIVIFAHGSGSSRFSPRNTQVAEVLNRRGFATVLVDLLTADEDEIQENRFDIGLLTSRLVAVTRFIQGRPELRRMSIGYFGASTGAASALKAAAVLGDAVHAVVSRGGRPDLAMEDLPAVKAPTLFIVGSLDRQVVEWNKEARAHISSASHLVLVDGATHLFEEPGKLEEVASLAAGWFEKYLLPHAQSTLPHIPHEV